MPMATFTPESMQRQIEIENDPLAKQIENLGEEYKIEDENSRYRCHFGKLRDQVRFSSERSPHLCKFHKEK